MRYWRAYRFVFDHPRWTQNLLFAAICMLSMVAIPIVGQLVLVGYLFVVIESMHRRKDDTDFPDFDFNQFVTYLVRGCWPVLVQFVVGLPFGLIVLGSGLVIFFSFTALGHGDETVIITLIVVVVLLLMALSVLLNVISAPLVLRAGLGQDFVAAFSFDFFRDFLGRMWKELLLSALFILITNFFLSLLGLLACYFGVFVTSALVMFAHHHLLYQIYELYLQRGGTPIPLKDDVPNVLPAENGK